jgi:cytochrome c-type biogenesis protein CcsB
MMTSLEPILLGIAAAAYTGSAVLAVLLFLRTAGAHIRWLQPFFVGAMVPHALGLVVRIAELQAFPIASVHDGLAVFGFMAALLSIFVATKGGIPQATAVAAPLLSVVTVLATVLEPTQAVPEAMRSVWLGVHIALALLGDAALAVAGVVAILYLVQERRLKQKRLPARGPGAAQANTGIHALPPLELLDRVSVRLIQIGFPLMTLGLLSGSLYGKQVWGVYWSWDPRNTISLLVWVLYALMIHARWMIGWRGRRAAILTVVGVVAILVAFVGLGLAGVGTHGKDYS